MEVIFGVVSIQLSDISENPNNDRIGGVTPNPNKCLMLDAFVV